MDDTTYDAPGPEPAGDDDPADRLLQSLVDADPADAPDLAEELAERLEAELNRIDGPRREEDP